MRDLVNLEIHVAHACNLSCESCSHYSNHAHAGIVSLEDADDWMSRWNSRLAPRVFSLLGGEPTIHPKLPEFVQLARKHWPRAALRIVTNGFFLHRHPTLPQVLKDDPNAHLSVSVHHDAPAYQVRLKPIADLLLDWAAKYRIRIVCTESHKDWTRRYRGFGSAMEPYEDNNPRQSWEHCPGRYCRQLFEGSIWKCAPLAYPGLQNEKHPLSEKWKPYLHYNSLGSSCTDAELNSFFDREEESACGMCPAKPERFELPIPLANLTIKRAPIASTRSSPLA